MRRVHPWDTEKPVSHQYEESYYKYYGWQGYWYGPYAMVRVDYPSREYTKRFGFTPEEKKWDPHLRSSREVSGYHIHAEDGDIGHIDDFCAIEDESVDDPLLDR